MTLLQADPTRVLEPMGEAWTGIVVPGLILVISIAVSFLLYRRFVRGAGRHPP